MQWKDIRATLAKLAPLQKGTDASDFADNCQCVEKECSRLQAKRLYMLCLLCDEELKQTISHCSDPKMCDKGVNTLRILPNVFEVESCVKVTDSISHSLNKSHFTAAQLLEFCSEESDHFDSLLKTCHTAGGTNMFVASQSKWVQLLHSSLTRETALRATHQVCCA